MKFTHREYIEPIVFPDGDYQFKTIYTKETDDYLLVMIKIEKADKSYNKISIFMRDSELDSDIMIRKHYFESIGKPELFKQENVSPNELKNTSGMVRITSRNNKKTNQLQNYVQDFLSNVQLEISTNDQIKDDDVNDLPF